MAGILNVTAKFVEALVNKLEDLILTNSSAYIAFHAEAVTTSTTKPNSERVSGVVAWFQPLFVVLKPT